MDEAHKELVKRLRAANYSDQPEWTPLEVPLDEAADALEALAGEVEFVKGQLAGTNRNIAGWLKSRDDNLKRAEDAEADRDRLKAENEEAARQAFIAHCAVMNDRDRLKAALQEIGRQQMTEEMDPQDIPFSDFAHAFNMAIARARKELGDAS